MSGSQGSRAQKQQLALNLKRSQRDSVESGQQAQGQGLPCHVVSVACGIVTVAFDVSGAFTLPNVTCPIAESIYTLLPIQVNDRGYVAPASARLGGNSGLGSGLAPLTIPGNLGGLVFVPIGNKTWVTPDANALVCQGPNGVIARTMDGKSIVTVNESGINLNWNGVTVILNSSGISMTASSGEINMNASSISMSALTIGMSAAVSIIGSLSVNGRDFMGHEHMPGTYKSGSTSITGDSGGVV